MRRALLAAFGVLFAGALPALADDASDAADIAAARKFIEPVMGKTCDFQTNKDGAPDGDNNVFPLSYRTKGQDQDSPDYKLTLVQLACSSGAYNFNSIYLTRNADGVWELLTFAEPTLDFDYTDENFSKLKAAPKVAGFIAVTQLTNSEYDPETKVLNSSAKWRGIGDAWSAGVYQFVEGVFVLKKYEVDPTFQAPGEEEPDPNVPESYVVFDATTPAK
ncbi:DUF1176 domain-containing protein [Rhizobium sp. TH2]|uniref:DUF1176 domain-containing protein n=1 Tax=Rhizobium sp. TH2 TaxID=2775403 RepID=UPI00215826D4|nr:DUF1176 domain-containing protein [Rhizobium sp. TH2]UVC11496.1 DUF1176 domain-containing protein [Rhizobium sp. TH2]